MQHETSKKILRIGLAGSPVSVHESFSPSLFLELEPGQVQIAKPEDQCVCPNDGQVHGKQDQAGLKQQQAIADGPEGVGHAKNRGSLFRWM